MEVYEIKQKISEIDEKLSKLGDSLWQRCS